MGEVTSNPIGNLNYFSPSENYYFTSMLYLPYVAYTVPIYPNTTPLIKVLAASWSHNSNYTEWTLVLKNGLKWDNGSPLNATDLWYTLKIYFYLGFLTGLDRLVVANSTAVDVYLNNSQPNFIYSFAFTNSYIVPYQTYGRIPLENVTGFSNLNDIVADGPFVIYNYTPGENPIVFQANPYYYEGIPHMKQLDVYIFSSLASEVASYKAGQLDALWDWAPYSIIEPLIGNLTGHTLYLNPYPAPKLLLFNLNVYPFNLTQFRWAIAYSINRTSIVERMDGPFNTTIPYDMLLPSMSQEIGLNGSAIPQYNPNPALASNLLSSIGFKKQGGYWYYPNGTMVTLNILTTQLGYGDVDTATLLKGQLESAGFQVNIQTITSSAFYGTIFNSKGWTMALVVDPAGYPPYPAVNLESIESTSGGLTPNESTYNGVAQWNYTYFYYLNSMSNTRYPYFSGPSDAYARLAAEYVANMVPVIPLDNVYNWLSLSNNYYWGSKSAHTGVYSDEALVQMIFWYDALWGAYPLTTQSAPSTPTTEYLVIAIIIVVVVAVILAAALLRRRR